MQLQHVAGSLDVERRWRWRELGLREVSVGAIVRRRLNNSADIEKKKVFGRDSSVAKPLFFRGRNNKFNDVFDSSPVDKIDHKQSAACNRRSRGRVSGRRPRWALP